jgi:hypothetical protein
LIPRGFSPNWREKRTCRVNTLRPISQLTIENGLEATAIVREHYTKALATMMETANEPA